MDNTASMWKYAILKKNNKHKKHRGKGGRWVKWVQGMHGALAQTEGSSSLLGKDEKGFSWKKHGSN